MSELHYSIINIFARMNIFKPGIQRSKSVEGITRSVYGLGEKQRGGYFREAVHFKRRRCFKHEAEAFESAYAEVIHTDHRPYYELKRFFCYRVRNCAAFHFHRNFEQRIARRFTGNFMD